MEKLVSTEDRQDVYKLCKRELGGKWAQVDPNDLILKPISDGFVNKLFYCFLPECMNTRYNKVIVRYVDYERLKNLCNKSHVLAISLILSAKKISPKLLSVFQTGTIIECIDCRYFNASDDLNPKIVALLAQKLAKFHSLVMPIPKDNGERILIDNLDNWFDTTLRQSYTSGHLSELIKANNYKTLLSMNLIHDFEWLRKTIVELKSPIVFSHNDFNRRNTLICESKDSSDLSIFMIDFDWTNYNYRGIDLGQYFSTWAQEELDFGFGHFPTDEQMSVFIDEYIREMTEIFGNSYTENPINSRESLIKESKIFALFGFAKDIIHCLWETQSGLEQFLANAEIRYNLFKVLKIKILKEYKLFNV